MENILKVILKLMGVVSAAIFITAVCTVKLDQYKAQAALMQIEHPTTADVEQELSCMAMNIYREAAAEPFEGKVAVAQVTMNRVNHKDFPDTVCDVVYEKNIFMKRVVCQFSWYCSNSTRARPVNSRAYEESYEVAKKVMLEDFKLESLENAIYYHSDTISPNWNYQLVTKIGAHIFYTDRG
jgi:spore germination cell wall hydrolase CwlJ-like protein